MRFAILFCSLLIAYSMREELTIENLGWFGCAVIILIAWIFIYEDIRERS